ncbi:MAG: hypothetical protein KIT22_04670, partial [Verrucomicrobiae bacterium]|nr:hypothetical protein [Verrucomicrobiae bacterium]
MNTQNEIETWLRKTPPPSPPADLLPALEREIELPPRQRMRVVNRPAGTALRVRWWRLWLPITGLGTATTALILGLVIFSGG